MKLFRFNKTQVIASIKAAIEHAAMILNMNNQPIQFEPYGFNIAQLQDLSMNLKHP